MPHVPFFWHSSVDAFSESCQNSGMRKHSSGEGAPNGSTDFLQLSRRERQIIDVLYRLQRASAAEIWEAVPNRPTYTAIRTHLSLLEDKGHIKHEKDGPRYIYSPVIPRDEMGRRAIEGVLRTFFDGSVDLVIKALFKRKEAHLSSQQIERIEQLIHEARKEGR